MSKYLSSLAGITPRAGTISKFAAIIAVSQLKATGMSPRLTSCTYLILWLP